MACLRPPERCSQSLKIDDKWKIKLNYTGNIFEILGEYGNIPLPPYIERNMTDEQYKNLGVKDLTIKLYPEARHEILNETNRAEVYADFAKRIDEMI